MCDAIHTARRVDGLPVLVELAQYPAEYDGRHGDEFAARLSEVASAVPIFGADDVGFCLGHVRRLLTGLDVALRCGRQEPAVLPSAGLVNARSLAVHLAAEAISLVAILDRSPDAARPARPPQPDLGAEVLRWLRQVVGELAGRTGETAIATTNPRAHLSRQLPADKIAAVEMAITSRWGCTIVTGTGDTVAGIAAAIVKATERRADQ